MINFEKLAQVPYMADYSKNDMFKAYVAKWESIWRRQSETGKQHAALIRAIECTNGCIQYAYRDGVTNLTLEQTRECMKLSMSAIKNKQITLKNGETIGFDPKLMEFYAQSVAIFYVLGRDRIDDAFQMVVDNFADVFTLPWIDRGRSYVYKYVNAIEPATHTNENSINPYIDLILGGII
jgi:hypothetical protein